MGWRALAISDIPQMSAIARAVHPDYFEDDSVFADRIALAPQGCWLLEEGGVALGYVLSHPWRSGSVPALNTPLGALPENPGTFYIHDLALLEAARGTGAARTIVKRLIALAAPCPTMSLVAVNRSAPFWTRFGFAPQTPPGLSDTLASYGSDAVYMVR